MNTIVLSSLAVLPAAGSLVMLFVWFACLAVIVWGVIALCKSMGFAIPQPVIIVLTVFVCLALILLIARAFGLLM